MGKGIEQFFSTHQTIRQPTTFRCMNPECAPKPWRPGVWFDFTADQPVCPKCKATYPLVDKRALIHLLVPNPMGNILGDMKRRFSIACHKSREELATQRNGEAASGDVNAVNCPGCLKVAKMLGGRFKVAAIAVGGT